MALLLSLVKANFHNFSVLHIEEQVTAGKVVWRKWWGTETNGVYSDLVYQATYNRTGNVLNSIDLETYAEDGVTVLETTTITTLETDSQGSSKKKHFRGVPRYLSIGLSELL